MPRPLRIEYPDAWYHVMSRERKGQDVFPLKSRRGVENEARDIAICMLRVIRGEPLAKIGQEFNLNNYSSVSSAVNRVRKKLESRKFKMHYDKIKGMI